MPSGHPTDKHSVSPLSEAAAALQGYFDTRIDLPPLNEVITRATHAYLEALDPSDPPAPHEVEQDLLALVNSLIKMVNPKADAPIEKLRVQRCLTFWQVAQILLRLHHIVCIAPTTEDTDREYDLLSMYIAEGRNRGIHTSSEEDIRAAARAYNTQLARKDFGEVHAVLREDAPRVQFCLHRDLVPVNNGIFHYGNQPLETTIGGKFFRFEPKALHPFDSAIVLRAKSRVDYVEDAPMVVISHPEDGDWEIGEWIADLFDQLGDEGLADLVWEILGALVRPHVRWGKSAWFYSEVGSNGKGTLCSLGRNLVGAGSHASIPLSDFGKSFALEPLVHANAIIVDENDVGAFVDKAANVKSVETNDVIQIDRKYRMPIAYQFHGFMIQCLNEFPRMKDKSESNYRRKLFVPFTKSFIGKERRYIKDDYLQRQDVLEYVLWYTLHRAGASSPGEYYQLSEPVATKQVLAEYKETNDPVRAFWQEFRLELAWDLAPFTFLYDLYKAWINDVSPSGVPVSNRQFIADLVAIVRVDDLWYCLDKSKPVRPGAMMVAPEPLIAEYDLKKWMDPHYSGNNLGKRGMPLLKANYRGLQRHVGPPAGGAATTKTDQPIPRRLSMNRRTRRAVDPGAGGPVMTSSGSRTLSHDFHACGPAHSAPVAGRRAGPDKMDGFNQQDQAASDTRHLLSSGQVRGTWTPSTLFRRGTVPGLITVVDVSRRGPVKARIETGEGLRSRRVHSRPSEDQPGTCGRRGRGKRQTSIRPLRNLRTLLGSQGPAPDRDMSFKSPSQDLRRTQCGPFLVGMLHRLPRRQQARASCRSSGNSSLAAVYTTGAEPPQPILRPPVGPQRGSPPERR